MARSVAIAALAILAAIAAIIAVGFTAPASAQSEEASGRIVARLLDDGRVEFGWQPAGGERVLPRARYFPADADVDRWLRSSPVEVGGAEIGRINARLGEDGRIEFAFTPTDGERILPPSRYFPADARVRHWLRSTEITTRPPEDDAASIGYAAVSAGGWGTGGWHTCAIRTISGAIECWGNNEYGQTDAPEGSFTAVSAGGTHTCAIRASSSAIECWGDNGDGQTDTPEGSFSAVSAGGWLTCGLRTSGESECWGYTTSAVTECALHVTTGSFKCVNRNQYGQSEVGTFRAVSAGGSHRCGLYETGTIGCWGGAFESVAVAPVGSYTAVSAGDWHTCAIRTISGAITCWKHTEFNEYGQTDAPEGSFTAVSAGGTHTCAIRTISSAIECWGDNGYGQTDTPEGSFTAVSAGGLLTCGLRETGTIECWGGRN